MPTVKGGDPTVHADAGESLEQACAVVVERRLHYLSYGGKKVKLLPGETAEALAARWADAKDEAPKKP